MISSTNLASPAGTFDLSIRLFNSPSHSSRNSFSLSTASLLTFILDRRSRISSIKRFFRLLTSSFAMFLEVTFCVSDFWKTSVIDNLSNLEVEPENGGQLML